MTINNIVMENQKILNPKSGRHITYGGKLHRQLMKSGVMEVLVIPAKPKKQRKVKKQKKEEKVKITMPIDLKQIEKKYERDEIGKLERVIEKAEEGQYDNAHEAAKEAYEKIKGIKTKKKPKPLPKIPKKKKEKIVVPKLNITTGFSQENKFAGGPRKRNAYEKEKKIKDPNLYIKRVEAMKKAREARAKKTK